MYEFVFHFSLLSGPTTYVYINSLVKFEGGFLKDPLNKIERNLLLQ